MSYPSPSRVEAAMSEAGQLIASLQLEGDEQLLADTLEGETDVFKILDRIGELALADTYLSEIARGRAQRLEKRAAVARNLMVRMMQSLGLSKLERAVFTASVRESKGKVQLVEGAHVPPHWLRRPPFAAQAVWEQALLSQA